VGLANRVAQSADWPSDARTAQPRSWLVWLGLFAVLAVAAAIRWRLLEVPLERDEGEYAYAGQLLLQGIPPYQLAYTMKWPGTYAAYAALMAIFGETTAGIHQGLLLVTTATAWLTFSLGRQMAGDRAGIVAAGTYALLAISPPTLGLAAHATHFALLPALAGVWLIHDFDASTRPGRFVAAGVLFGLAALAKQPAAVFAAFAVSWLVWQAPAHGKPCGSHLVHRLAWLALGGLLPIAITSLLLFGAGVFDRFWLWTVDYAAQYAALVSPSDAIALLRSAVSELFWSAPILWLLGLTGTGLVFMLPSLAPRRGFLVGFSLFSFLAVCPTGYFRGHYFVLALPAVGLMSGVAVHVISDRLGRTVARVPSAVAAFVLFALAATQMLVANRTIFFERTPRQVSRALYGTNPFPESVEIARFIDENTPRDATIAVLGSEPQIYFYARRHSATGYIYVYPLMEPQPFARRMQVDMIREIEAAEPRMIVFVSVGSSWLKRPKSDRHILDWFRDYEERKKLRLVGFVEIASPEETRSRLPHDGSPVTARADAWLAIYENPAGR
jgi:hypothetical protein